MDKRRRILVGISLAILVVLFLIGPIPQDKEYHDLADKRQLFGVPNFFDVISNLPFLLIGIWGISKLFGSHIVKSLKTPFFIFSLGVVLTSFGSSYYHLNPENSTLFWDRLPMTLAFMSFFSAIISDYINEQAGRKMLAPALIFGLSSVIFWYFTEKSGSGDLRPYVVVQFLPGVLIPLILLMYDPASGQKRPVVMAFVFYGVAKLFEVLDCAVFERSSGMISGHTVKHLFAAIGAYYVVKMFLGTKNVYS